MSTDHVRENWLWDAIYDAWQQSPIPDGVDPAEADKAVERIEQAVNKLADVIVPYIYWRGRMDALEVLALDASKLYGGLNFTVSKHYVEACEQWQKLGLPGGDLRMETPDYSKGDVDV